MKTCFYSAFFLCHSEVTDVGPQASLIQNEISKTYLSIFDLKLFKNEKPKTVKQKKPKNVQLKAIKIVLSIVVVFVLQW